MTNYKMKFVKSAAALALGASVITSAVVAGDLSASAKTTYKLSNGKLVNAKTKKAIKGYKVYKSVLYKDGKKFTGLYSKRYYKAGVKATGTYKGAYYVKGTKKVTTGTYNGAYYVKGVKKVTTGTYNKAYYVKGKKVVTTGTYNGAYYVKGVKKVTTGTYNKAYYVKGVKKVTSGLYKEKLYKDGVLNVGLALYKDKLYKDADLNKGLEIYKDKYYFDANLANDTYDDNGVEKAFENGVEVGAKVKSVEVINGTTVEVKFNKAVDKEDAEKATIKLENTSLTNGTLSEDGRTLTLTSTTAIDAKDATVEVPAIATKADKTVKTKKYVTVINYKDELAPKIIGTEQVSSTQVKVKFSEPVAEYSAFTFQYADGKAVEGVTSPKVAAGATEVTFDLSDSKVETGKAITVTAIGLKDVAGNIITPNPTTFDITKLKADGVSPVVSSVTQTGAKTFEATFSKAVKAGTVEIDGYTLTLAPKTENATSDTTFVVAANKVLEGVQNVTLTSFADIDGQKIADTTKVVTFAKDEVAPTVTSSKLVKVDGKENIELTFDKAVTPGDVKVTGSYVKDYVTTSLTEAVTVTAVAPKDDKSKKVLLVPVADFATIEGAQYDVKINSTVVKSDAEQAMKEATASFTRSKDDAAIATNDDVFTKDTIAVAQGSTPSEVTVTFKDEVDGASAINTANYVIDGAEVESAQLAPFKDGEQVVTLKLKANSNLFTGVRNIAVSNVKVKNSTKVMQPVNFTDVSLTENVAATLKSAKLVANNQIELTFSEDVNAEDIKDAKLFAGTEEVKDVVAAVSKTDAKVVTVTLPENATLTVAQLQAGLKVDLTVSDSNNNETKVEKATVAQ